MATAVTDGDSGVGATRTPSYNNLEELTSSSMQQHKDEKDKDVTQSLSILENRQIFDWIEMIVGMQFISKSTSTSLDSRSRTQSSPKEEPERKFALLEFELGKDEPNDDDFMRCSLGEGMIIPLRVIYNLDGERHSDKLIMRLPTYFYDYAEDFDVDRDPSVITVHTHETYFYSCVLNTIEDFLRAEGVDLKLPIPECFYVKHTPKYEMRKTPALIENLMETKSLLVVADPKGDGYSELESVEDVGVNEGLAVMTGMARIHAVTWAIQEKTGRELNDIWQDLLSVKDQEAINDHVIEGSFEFFANGTDDVTSDEHPLYAMLLFQRPKIEKIVKQALYPSGPDVPNALLHMMIGGPNLFFRKQVSAAYRGSESDPGTESPEPGAVECCISSWSLATIGNPILDVALFTSVSLMPETRSRCKSVFLERYWAVFTETAMLFNLEPRFTFAYLSQEFEKCQVWSFLFMIAACKQEEMKTEEMRDVLETILDILQSIPETDD